MWYCDWHATSCEPIDMRRCSSRPQAPSLRRSPPHTQTHTLSLCGSGKLLQSLALVTRHLRRGNGSCSAQQEFRYCCLRVCLRVRPWSRHCPSLICSSPAHQRLAERPLSCRKRTEYRAHFVVCTVLLPPEVPAEVFKHCLGYFCAIDFIIVGGCRRRELHDTRHHQVGSCGH